MNYLYFNRNDMIAYQAIGVMNRVFAIGPGNRGSIQGRVRPKS